MGRKKILPILEDVEITDIAAEGNSIARIDNKVLFVPQCIPGDIVDVKLTRKRTSYMEGYVTAIKKKSPLRIEPFCNHFGICGGCKWQHLPYAEQLKWKHKHVVDSFQRIAKVEIGKTNQILPSENTRFYRNKLEYTFSDNRWLPKEMITGDKFVKEPGLGFHIPGMFDKVLDIDFCYHQPEPSNKIRLALKKYAVENNIGFFNLRSKEGMLRNVIIRNTNIGEWMVILVFAKNEKNVIDNTLSFLKNEFPEINSLMYVVNNKANDTINDLEIHLYYGRDYIIEVMEDLKFIIGPKSFFQTNSNQAYRLYSIVREFANLSGNEIVYDLYTGTGTIANFVAKKSIKVIGIEFVPEAIEDAIKNSDINNIKNTAFFTGDMKDILNEKFIHENGKPDIIITTSPRRYAHVCN